MSYFLGMSFLWIIYYPLLFILKNILFVVPKVRDRFSFERKNQNEAGARSFRQDHITADLCFEFSSEGEYQQVASLIDDGLKLGKKIELVFFSPSVEKTILNLWTKYPDQIRYFRYPVLSLGFSSWISSQNLVLVRYDLFPEFLIWSLKPGRKFKFVWVTFKKERLKGQGISFWKQAFLMRSSFTVFATEADSKQAQALGYSGAVYDFRMEQIQRRVSKRTDTFNKLFSLYGSLRSELDSYPREKRLIMGNSWPEDLKLLENVPNDVLIVIVPHQLKPEIIAHMLEILIKLGRKAEIISDSTSALSKTNTFILNKKGILCELYQDFGKAYVGGGFGASVHSLLEPLISGSESISCGPVNQRSTEFDLCQAYGNLTEVRNPMMFQDWLDMKATSLGGEGKTTTQPHNYSDVRDYILLP